MTSAKINGIDVHYQAFGEGETIVFAHGAGGNLLSWWQQIPYFSQNYRCITIDQRGFGHSLDVPNGPGSGAFVEDLVGLLDYLEIDSAHLVAQSMGGRTMLGFAVAYPHRTKSLVMADTVGGMAVPEVEELQARLRDTNAANVSIGHRAISRGFVQRNPALANLYLQISDSNPPRSEPAGGQQPGPSVAQLGDLQVPTLFIVGKEDQIAPPAVIEAAAKTIPGARTTRVPKAGHSVYFEKPDIFNFEVSRFIQSVTEPAKVASTV